MPLAGDPLAAVLSLAPMSAAYALAYALRRAAGRPTRYTLPPLPAAAVLAAVVAVLAAILPAR